MVPLAVSSEECVEALSRAGYRVVSRSGTSTVITHVSRRTITVPHADVLEPGVIDTLLREAGVSSTTFLELLSMPAPTSRRGGVPSASGMRPRYVRQTG